MDDRLLLAVSIFAFHWIRESPTSSVAIGRPLEVPEAAILRADSVKLLRCWVGYEVTGLIVLFELANGAVRAMNFREVAIAATRQNGTERRNLTYGAVSRASAIADELPFP